MLSLNDETNTDFRNNVFYVVHQQYFLFAQKKLLIFGNMNNFATFLGEK